MGTPAVLIAPTDVRRAADTVTSCLSQGVDRDWSVAAGVLEWSVEETIGHVAGALCKYALYLASRSSRFLAIGARPWPDASRAERLEAVRSAAEALANVAEATPDDVRAYHAVGMLEADGYCSLACSEILVHGHDAAQGLGLLFEPPEDLVERLVRRAYPWLGAESHDAWRLLLWHTGRVELPGRESHGDDAWTSVHTPLSEWDGEIPRRHPHPVIEWVRDAGARWRPVYREGGR